MSADPPFRLDGRKALVTGGASGIGEQTVRVLSQSGASVVIADLNLKGAESLPPNWEAPSPPSRWT